MVAEEENGRGKQGRMLKPASLNLAAKIRLRLRLVDLGVVLALRAQELQVGDLESTFTQHHM